MTKSNNYITSEGYKKLQTELLELIKHDRPKIVEIVSWAAEMEIEVKMEIIFMGKKN